MTRGQIARLQELEKCWMDRMARSWVKGWLLWSSNDELRFSEPQKAYLRRLWHQYRHQIAAMRKNRGKA
jgi:hypothetical protein